jgi:hypothetical protein
VVAADGDQQVAVLDLRVVPGGAGRQAEAENMRGKSPLGFARLVGDQEMIRMLEAAIANDDILD